MSAPVLDLPKDQCLPIRVDRRKNIPNLDKKKLPPGRETNFGVS